MNSSEFLILRIRWYQAIYSALQSRYCLGLRTAPRNQEIQINCTNDSNSSHARIIGINWPPTGKIWHYVILLWGRHQIEIWVACAKNAWTLRDSQFLGCLGYRAMNLVLLKWVLPEWTASWNEVLQINNTHLSRSLGISVLLKCLIPYVQYITKNKNSHSILCG